MRCDWECVFGSCCLSVQNSVWGQGYLADISIKTLVKFCVDSNVRWNRGWSSEHVNVQPHAMTAVQRRGGAGRLLTRRVRGNENVNPRATWRTWWAPVGWFHECKSDAAGHGLQTPSAEVAGGIWERVRSVHPSKAILPARDAHLGGEARAQWYDRCRLQDSPALEKTNASRDHEVEMPETKFKRDSISPSFQHLFPEGSPGMYHREHRAQGDRMPVHCRAHKHTTGGLDHCDFLTSGELQTPHTPKVGGIQIPSPGSTMRPHAGTLNTKLLLQNDRIFVEILL